MTAPAPQTWPEVERWYSRSSIIRTAKAYSQAEGTHVMNPYHNVQHCESVALSALWYAARQGVSAERWETLALAGLFHDFNHSGKPLSEVPDSVNIENATAGFREFSTAYPHSGDVSEICAIIESTEVCLVRGALVFKAPLNTLDVYIRDADVTQLCFPLGRLSQPGLARELGRPFDAEFERNATAFLRSVTLHTDAAETLRRGFLGLFSEGWERLRCR